MRTFKKGPHIKMMRNKRNTSVKGKAMNIKPGPSKNIFITSIFFDDTHKKLMGSIKIFLLFTSKSSLKFFG